MLRGSGAAWTRVRRRNAQRMFDSLSAEREVLTTLRPTRRVPRPESASQPPASTGALRAVCVQVSGRYQLPASPGRPTRGRDSSGRRSQLPASDPTPRSAIPSSVPWPGREDPNFPRPIPRRGRASHLATRGRARVRTRSQLPTLASRGPSHLPASIPRHTSRSSRSENLEVCLR
jgi:hypothetical protein